MSILLASFSHIGLLSKPTTVVTFFGYLITIMDSNYFEHDIEVPPKVYNSRLKPGPFLTGYGTCIDRPTQIRV